MASTRGYIILYKGVYWHYEKFLEGDIKVTRAE